MRGERGSSRQHSYAGALTMLVTGAVTFVASLSLAVGPHLVPDRATAPVQHVVHRAAPPPVVQAPAPEPNPHPLLTKLLERPHGQQNSAPDQPAPGQAPPASPGAPPP
jgi:hypothetical protein